MWCCSWAFSHKLIELLSIFHTQKWFVCFGCSFVEAHDFLFSPRNLAQFRCGCGCECNTQLFAPTAIVKHRMPLSKCRRPMWLSCNYYSCSFFLLPVQHDECGLRCKRPVSLVHFMFALSCARIINTNERFWIHERKNYTNALRHRDYMWHSILCSVHIWNKLLWKHIRMLCNTKTHSYFPKVLEWKSLAPPKYIWFFSTRTFFGVAWNWHNFW